MGGDGPRIICCPYDIVGGEKRGGEILESRKEDGNSTTTFRVCCVCCFALRVYLISALPVSDSASAYL